MAKATPLRAKLNADDAGTTATIELYEYIDPYWGFSAIELSDKLKQLTSVNTIKVRIHSRGGNAMEGFALYSMLLDHEAEVEVEIIGVAASAASVVAMSGDRIKISEVGFLMIHDPWVFADGNSTALREAAEMLDRIQPAIVRAYQRHAKISADEIAEAMSKNMGAGTWYDAEAAVTAGLAHEVFSGHQPENRLSPTDLDVPDAAKALFEVKNSVDPRQGDHKLFADVLSGLRAGGSNLDPLLHSDDMGRLTESLDKLLPQEA